MTSWWRSAANGVGTLAAWAPYFDDGERGHYNDSNVSNVRRIDVVNAVIFLCPMANFDRSIPEDPSVNSLVQYFPMSNRLDLIDLVMVARLIPTLEDDLRKQVVSRRHFCPLPEQNGSLEGQVGCWCVPVPFL